MWKTLNKEKLIISTVEKDEEGRTFLLCPRQVLLMNELEKLNNKSEPSLLSLVVKELLSIQNSPDVIIPYPQVFLRMGQILHLEKEDTKKILERLEHEGFLVYVGLRGIRILNKPKIFRKRKVLNKKQFEKIIWKMRNLYPLGFNRHDIKHELLNIDLFAGRGTTAPDELVDFIIGKLVKADAVVVKTFPFPKETYVMYEWKKKRDCEQNA